MRVVSGVAGDPGDSSVGETGRVCQTAVRESSERKLRQETVSAGVSVKPGVPGQSVLHLLPPPALVGGPRSALKLAREVRS